MCYTHALVLHLVLGETDWEKPLGGVWRAGDPALLQHWRAVAHMTFLPSL